MPELYAAFTMPAPPVATIRSAWRISSCVVASDGAGSDCTRSAGAPTCSHAARMYPTTASVAPWVRGCGAQMIALRPLTANSALTGGVASGPVVGISAATTPTGLAIFTRPARRVLLDHADRAHPGHVGQHAGHPLVDLGDLVRVVAEPALVHRELGQRLGVVLAHHGPGHGGDQLVHLLLGVVLDRAGGRPGPPHDVGHLVMYGTGRLLTALAHAR